MDLDVEWLMPEEGEGSLCTCPIAAEQVEGKLSEMAQKPFAVYMTAPDYLGYSPDIRGIAEVCKQADIPLLVDNAHGAYLKFLQPSRHPIDLGAAMCCDSAHKTLPVLTGGAYLHFSAEWAKKVGHQAKKAMEIFGSTSPSYLMLQSLDRCNAYLADGYPEKLASVIEKVDTVKNALWEQGWEVMDGDPLKLTVFTGKMGYTGEEAAEILRENGVECEFADLDAVVLMATPENKDEDFKKVISVLTSLPKREEIQTVQMPFVLPEQKMKIRDAMFSLWEKVDCEDAVGRICASPCVSCPPAIPIAASGEEITAEMAELFKAYGIEKIEVVK